MIWELFACNCYCDYVIKLVIQSSYKTCYTDQSWLIWFYCISYKKLKFDHRCLYIWQRFFYLIVIVKSVYWFDNYCWPICVSSKLVILPNSDYECIWLKKKGWSILNLMMIDYIHAWLVCDAIFGCAFGISYVVYSHSLK